MPTGLHKRKFLKKLGLLDFTESLKKKFAYIEKNFSPCTPHLLLAVHKGLHWCEEKNPSEVGDYLEFGIFRGFTFWYAQALARDMGIQNMRFFGFDSFFGLPPLEGIDKEGEFQEGAYYSSKKEVEKFLNQYGVDWDRTHLFEGLFQKTLTKATREKHGLKKCSLCVIDCDLYESTRLALDFIEPLIGDSMVILFDDWMNFGADPAKGEQKAFSEFLKKNPRLSAEPFVEFGGHGKGFVLRSVSNTRD